MGLYTTEELKYSPEGVLYSRGPDEYKIPTITDVPEEFNVSLLPSSQTPLTIYSSKVSTQTTYYCTMWRIRQHNKWKQVDKMKNKCQALSGPNQDRLLKFGGDSPREIQRFQRRPMTYPMTILGQGFYLLNPLSLRTLKFSKKVWFARIIFSLKSHKMKILNWIEVTMLLKS